jgi:hypothetical protein
MNNSLHRGPVGENGVCSFTGTFERTRKCKFNLFSWSQRTLKVKSRGHLELNKE